MKSVWIFLYSTVTNCFVYYYDISHFLKKISVLFHSILSQQSNLMKIAIPILFSGYLWWVMQNYTRSIKTGARERSVTKLFLKNIHHWNSYRKAPLKKIKLDQIRDFEKKIAQLFYENKVDDTWVYQDSQSLAPSVPIPL